MNRAAREGQKAFSNILSVSSNSRSIFFAPRRIETSTLKSDNDLVLPSDDLSPLGDMSPCECKRIAHAGSNTTATTLIALPALAARKGNPPGG